MMLDLFGDEISYNGITISNGLQDTNAFDLVNATILETNSEYGDNVQITPKMFADNVQFLDEGDYVTLVYELGVKSSTSEDSYILNFTQTIYKLEFNEIYGDVNQDGHLNVQDVVIIINAIVAATTDELPDDGDGRNIADITNDGQVNILDIVQLIGIIVG